MAISMAISISKINFKNQSQFQKSISISKINFNFKNQFQFQKSISISKINFNFKNQFQKSISRPGLNLISKLENLNLTRFALAENGAKLNLKL